MQDMDKDQRFTLRITAKERVKINECATLMGVSAGEFLRRCMQVMLMVMGDKASEKAIKKILKEATGTMKMGAGLATRTPDQRSHRYPPVQPDTGRKARESGSH